MHGKPCGLLDVGGYWEPLLTVLDRAVAEQFARPEHRRMVVVESRPAALLDRFRSYAPPHVGKWIRPAER